ncbi:MAG TPA: RraA family protein [Methanothermobacter sp.]|nr:dimethylmenaquinone methyltransferase [Methanothermobacter sp. MT-2]HHW05340.1 RraA family protein [Methanothermobacter sp.]HOK73095.1 RraA family protein [Methanothermobacter sp.]HOL68727.1 RraA family protein [Methanothermobacter sp.]HPQ04620.1 RraA family protein [Methanothermobacter sp.]
MKIEGRISPKNLLKNFTGEKTQIFKLSTPQVSDALNEISGYNGAIHSLKPLNRMKIFGPLVTAKTKDHDWGTSVKAIDHASESDVIFIMTEGDENAVWGELTSKTARKKKIAGTIIYGACRDLDAISRLDFPVFSKKVVPNAGKPLAMGEVNIELECEGVRIRPGDYVFGDESGIVIIPKELFNMVIERALKIKMKESNIEWQIEDGVPLSRILGLK